MSAIVDPEAEKLAKENPGLVDKTGNTLDTNKNGEESRLPDGEEKPAEAKQPAIAAEFSIEEKFFVVKLPVLNNLYQVLGHLAWAEDRIRQVYIEAQQRRLEKQSTLVKPTGFFKGFRNKWRT